MENSTSTPHYDYNYYSQMGYYNQNPSNVNQNPSNVNQKPGAPPTPSSASTTPSVAPNSNTPQQYGYPENMTQEQYYNYYASYYQYYQQYCNYYHQTAPPSDATQPTKKTEEDKIEVKNENESINSTDPDSTVANPPTATMPASTAATIPYVPPVTNFNIPPPIYYPPSQYNYYPTYNAPKPNTSTTAPVITQPPQPAPYNQPPPPNHQGNKPSKPRVSRFQPLPATAKKTEETKPAAVSNKTSIWPDPLKNYVQRAFNSVEDKLKDKMQDLLKEKLEIVYSKEMVDKIDWDNESLPKIAVDNNNDNLTPALTSTSTCISSTTSTDTTPKKSIIYGLQKPILFTPSQHRNNNIRGRGSRNQMRGAARQHGNATTMTRKLSSRSSRSSSNSSSSSTSVASRSGGTGRKRYHQHHNHYTRRHSSSRSSSSSRSTSYKHRNRKRSHSSVSPLPPNHLRTNTNNYNNTNKFRKLSAKDATTPNNNRKSDDNQSNNNHVFNRPDIPRTVNAPNNKLTSRLNITVNVGNNKQPRNKKLTKKQMKYQQQQQIQYQQQQNQMARITDENNEKLAERASRFKEHLIQDTAQQDVDGQADEWSTNGLVVGTSQQLEKSYLRLTRAPLPNEVRPPDVLRKGLEHVSQLWYRDHVEYRFICEQMKSIRQDLTVQGIRDEFTLSVYKVHATIALEAADHQEFNQCQSQIKLLYEEGIECDQIAEFTAYRILYYMYTRDFLNINTTLAAIQQDQYLCKAQQDNETLAFAIKLRTAWSTNNYFKFFSYSKSPQVPKLCSCIIAWFLEREQKAAFKTIIKSFRPNLDLDYLSNILGFANNADFLKFMGQILPDGEASILNMYVNKDESCQKFDMKLLFNIL